MPKFLCSAVGPKLCLTYITQYECKAKELKGDYFQYIHVNIQCNNADKAFHHLNATFHGDNVNTSTK